MAVASHLPDRSRLELPLAARGNLRFPVRSRLGVVRDLALIGVCVAIVIGFLAQIWRAPPPPAFRAANVASVAARA
jgi:hypothetical protein